MTQENKAQEPKKPEEKPQEAKKPEPEKKAEIAAKPPAEKKPEVEKKPQAPQQAPEAAQKKNKKIGQMTLKEVEEKLNSIKEKMGGFDSRYAQELLKRKSALTKG